MGEVSLLGVIITAIATVLAAALACWGVVYTARRTDQSRAEAAQAAHDEEERHARAVAAEKARQEREDERHERERRDVELIRQWERLNEETRERADAAERRSAAAEDRATAAESQVSEIRDEMGELRAKLAEEARFGRASLAFIAELVAMWPNTRPLPLIPLDLYERVDPGTLERFRRDHPPGRPPTRRGKDRPA